MRIPQLIRALSAPLALEPTTLFRLASVFRRKLAGASFTAAELHAELGVPMPDDRPAREQSRVAIIPVYGVISQHPQSMGASTEAIGAMFAAALGSPNVDSILLDVDSPGGTITGVPELAAQIFAGRGVKPITAIANGLAASAGYWIAAAASKVVVTPSGEAGSIGVYMLHEDWSKNLEQEGIKLTAISAGKFKTEGAPWEPLTEDAQAFYQAQVTEAYGWFVRDVAQFRSGNWSGTVTPADVRAGYGEGRVLTAKDAKAANLVDQVATFEATLERLIVARPKGRRAETRKREVEILAQ